MAIKSMKCLVVWMCFTGPLLLQAAGQQLAPLPVEAVVGGHSFGLYTPVEISPDGKRVAYVVVDNRRIASTSARDRLQTGIARPPFAGDVCSTDMTSGATECPTAKKGNNWAPTWSPDGRYLAFLSDRDGSDQAKIWVWEAASNQLRKVSEVSVRASAIQWLPDGQRLLATVLPEGMTPTGYAMRILGPDGVRSETNDSSGPTVSVYRSTAAEVDRRKGAKSPQGSLENYLRDLAVIDVGSGLVSRIDRGNRVVKYSASSDASHVAFTSPTRFADSATQQILFDLVVINMKTGERWTAASDVPLDYDGSSFSWSPDGSRLAFQTSSVKGKGACYIVEVNGMSPPRKVTESLRQSPYKAAAPLWDAGGRTIYFINGGTLWAAAAEGGKSAEVSRLANHTIFQLSAGPDGRLWSSNAGRSSIVLARADDTKQSGFYSIDLETGRSSRLLEDGRCFTCAVREEWLTAHGLNMLYFAGDAEHDTDLWLADAKFQNVRRLTRLNPQFERYMMGSARLVEWRSLDGEPLKGALLLPAGYLPGKLYPLIVNVYGGALHSNRLAHFGFGYAGTDNMQLFATHGYAVLLPDAPQHTGTPMLDLVKTVLPGVNKVIEMGIADPDRLGVMGHSYGGYSTLSLIAQTTRFKAAAMSGGTGDLVASYGEMHKDGSTYQVSIMETGQGSMGGTPWQFRDRYIENSPFFHLDRIETPLLILHGADDQAVASLRGDEVFVGMRRLGKEAEYARYEGEDHTPLDWSYSNQLDYCARLIAWFDRYLKGSAP
ncbi:MAG TPA: prolyl oligopeptidase family serine peptidase [Candidatus Acidoferrum sp.]|nr:prolyl oligopeptidase family serine peptidase [Candidatus Acidoferrum sp.]